MQRPDANSTSPAVVLDSSALLAYLQDEPGYDRVLAALVDGAAISTVNLAEVFTKTVASGHAVEPIGARLRAMGLAIIPFTARDASVAAELMSFYIFLAARRFFDFGGAAAQGFLLLFIVMLLVTLLWGRIRESYEPVG